MTPVDMQQDGKQDWISGDPNGINDDPNSFLYNERCVAMQGENLCFHDMMIPTSLVEVLLIIPPYSQIMFNQIINSN